MAFLMRIWIISLLAFSMLGCTSVKQKSFDTGSKEDIKALLLSGENVQATIPFIPREFNPWLDGTWIGQAVSYGFYRKGQAPGLKGPSDDEILEDLNIIVKHWNLIRVYNADEDTRRVLELIKKRGLPLKVMLGIWLEAEDNSPRAKTSNITNFLMGIELANAFPDQVFAVNVGNETQVYWSGHRLDTDALIRYLRVFRANTSVPITTADDYNFWNKPESRILANELDFITVHAYPLWNGLALDSAFPWLDNTLAALREVHPEKNLVLGEIGWATDYDPSKLGDGQQGSLIKGEVGSAAQAQFLGELDSWIERNQIPTFLFEAFDEPWKGGGESSGPNEIEKNWGVFRADRTPKESFQNYLVKKNATQK